MEKATIIGHSFGGATTLLSAIQDLRFKVAICLDAWAFPLKHEQLNSIVQPTLLINTETLGTEKHNLEKFSEIFPKNSQVSKETLSEQSKQAWTITGSSHLQQCDVPFILGKLPLLLAGVRERADLNTVLVHDLTTAMALQFIQKYLGKLQLYKPTSVYINKVSEKRVNIWEAQSTSLNSEKGRNTPQKRW